MELTTAEIRNSVRKRPGMFFGSSDSKGIVHVVNELVSNGVDLYLQGSASWLGVSIIGDTINYSDDGPGLPFDVPGPDFVSLAEHYFTHFHDAPTADNHAPHLHMLGGGLGLMPVNAACEHLEVRTWRSGNLWRQCYSEGLPVEDAHIAERGSGKGTTIEFRMDRTVFSARVPEPSLLRKMMFEAAHLVPGISIHLGKEIYHAPNGLGDLLNLYHPPDLGQARNVPCYINTKNEDIQVQVSAIGETTEETSIRSWANGARTLLHGTHVDGLKDALRWMKWKPAAAMIHVIMQEPAFSAPTRSRLNNPEVRTLVREMLKPELAKWQVPPAQS